MAESPNGVAEAGAGSAFLSRDFRLYQTARLLVILGAEAQSVAVAWQVYQITRSARALGLTQLALFAPGIFFMLAAGHVADRYDRRWIILTCYSAQAVCTIALMRFALHPTGHVWPIYSVLLGVGLGRAFSGPASAALVPSLVPTKHFVNAVTWGSDVCSSDLASAGSAFLSRDFRLYQTARLLVILGAEAQSVAVAWQVY